MNLAELKRQVDFLYDTNDTYATRSAGSLAVGIQVKRIGSVGGTPLVDVHSIYAGFDWDRGRILIVPSVDLREIGRDEIKSLIDKHEELGRSNFVIRGLKAEVKKLKEKIASLENQNSSKTENQDSEKPLRKKTKKALLQENKE